MEEYRGNSHKAREIEVEAAESREQPGSRMQDGSRLQHQKRVEKAVSTAIVSRKKSIAKKLLEVFIADEPESIRSRILNDIVVPGIKNAFLDTMDAIFGGERKTSYTAYRSSGYRYGTPTERQESRAQPRDIAGDRYSYDDIVISSRGEAEEVLERMDELIEVYGIVSIADLYDLVDVRTQPTDFKYGWTNISTAKIIRVRDGYKIKLPRAIPID